MRECKDLDNVFFLIVGAGTEYHLLDDYVKKSKQTNLKLMQRLPKEDYDKMIGACDVGMIFLDYRFTIPNFPSRLLAYMSAKLPVLAVTDPNTDVGDVLCKGNFGFWCESNNPQQFKEMVKKIINQSVKELGENGYEYMIKNYSNDNAYNAIIRHFN